MLLFWTILAHLLYDFHWQGDFIATYKGKKPFILCVHCLTWTMLICLPLLYYGAFVWWKAVFLFLTHALSDNWKSKLPRNDEFFWSIYVDQLIHFITILIVVLL